ncbi:hypothetical protein [Natronobiforma cellulositropha]|uniref:hypothetical protein n=1 Tax=Natronobiforma cellulositropha TaxID=1679076 RepID=UPI0021D5F80F|nr:hypothetical protein [Natronobiforma cellulositropha]
MSPELDTPGRPPEADRLDDPATADGRERPASVFPYDGERSGTALTTSRTGGRLSSVETDEVGPAGSTACPACGAATINGAGLFACLECSWTGRLR